MSMNIENEMHGIRMINRIFIDLVLKIINLIGFAHANLFTP